MKKLLIPLSVLFLAACGAANAPADATVEVNSDTVLDDKLFQEATSANNLSKCDEIADSTKKDECKMVVQSFLTIVEAVAKLDTSLCEEISDERYKENCEDSVNEKMDDLKVQEENQKLEEEAMTTEAQAIKNGNADDCNSIKDENRKYSCRYNVLTNQALNLNDPKFCEEIGKDNLVQGCKDNFGSGN